MVGSSLNSLPLSLSLYLYPTDTVWGIGGTIYSLGLYQAIEKIKMAPSGKPVSILFGHFSQVRDFFQLPSDFAGSSLGELFKMQATLCLDLKLLKIAGSIPPWIHQDSPFVAVRCLEDPAVQQIVQEVGGPLITTSLNIHGEGPVLSYQDAGAFRDRIVERFGPTPLGMKLVLIPPTQKDQGNLSGVASSIVSFDPDKKEVRFIREGARASEIRKHFQKYFG